MKASKNNRRHFIKDATRALGGMAVLSALPAPLSAAATKEYLSDGKEEIYEGPPRIRFAVIGINHGHIHSQVDTVMKAGGAFVSFYAKEADLAQEFAKRYPQAKLARSEKEILEDQSIQLI